MENYFVNILCQAHIQQTNLPNSPFPWKTSFDLENIDV